MDMTPEAIAIPTDVEYPAGTRYAATDKALGNFSSTHGKGRCALHLQAVVR